MAKTLDICPVADTLLTTMKQLDTQFTSDNNKFTQVKRTDKAAIYKRETLEGKLVSYEVFAIRTKNDAEVYPNKTAFGRGILTWAWCPADPAKAEVYYDRLNKDQVVLAQVDPETGDILSPVDEPVAEMEIPVPTNGEKVQAEVTIEPDIVDPTPATPSVPTPSIQTDKKTKTTVVPVATVTKNEVKYHFPKGEFTQAQFAKANGLPERGVVWSKLDKLVSSGVLTKSLRKMGKGRPSQIFTVKK